MDGGAFIYWTYLCVLDRGSSSEVKETLAIMAKKLQRIILPASILATLIGLHLVGVIGAFSMGWFHYKLFLLILLFGYQHACGRLTKKLALKHFKNHQNGVEYSMRSQ